ncbi:MAG: exosortase/archaeosortase family protein [Phycisphaerae bacterium]
MSVADRHAARAAGSVFRSRTMLVLWFALVAACIWTMRETWSDLVNIVSVDEEQSHIILVPVVAVWLAWIRRIRLRHLSPSGTLFGPVIILIGWAMSWIGFHHAIQAAWHAGAVVALVGALVTGLGVNTLLKLFPAFAVLAFAVPLPGAIRHAVAGPLQTAGAQATQVILETFGVPIERSVNLLTLNGHDIAVAEACNGMRMVLALILVTYAFAFSIPFRGYARVVVLVASPLVALACNIARLIPTTLFYGYASHSFADAFHDASGWLMLPLAFLALRGIHTVLGWAQVPVTRFNLAYQ